jgi:hypothetical protein
MTGRTDQPDTPLSELITEETAPCCPVCGLPLDTGNTKTQRNPEDGQTYLCHEKCKFLEQ